MAVGWCGKSNSRPVGREQEMRIHWANSKDQQKHKGASFFPELYVYHLPDKRIRERKQALNTAKVQETDPELHLCGHVKNE